MVKKDNWRPVQALERYEELSVQRLIQHCQDNLPVVLRYLPDELEPSNIDRMYLASVMNSIQESSVENLRIAAIERSRAGNRDPFGNGNNILLKEEFEQLIRNQLFPLGQGQRLLSRLESRHDNRQ